MKNMLSYFHVTTVVALLLTDFRRMQATMCAGDIGSEEYTSLSYMLSKLHGDGWEWRSPYATYGVPWNSNITEACNWQGVTCARSSSSSSSNSSSSSSQRCTVTKVELKGYSVFGQFSDAVTYMGGLTNLEVLDLSSNNIYGTLPEALSSLFDRLQFLDLSSNDFSGNLPPAFSTITTTTALSPIKLLTNLSHFSLAYNAFSGAFPSFVCNNYNKLQVLDLAQNNFSGPILSSCFTTLAALKVLSVGGNSLTGAIPPNINLPNMQYLSIESNHFSGSLPSSLFVDSPFLEVCSAWGNDLSGAVPAEALSSAGLLRVFDVSTNKLTGDVSTVFNNFRSSLEVIKIGCNKFEGSILTLDQLENLKVLSLCQNGITGAIPELGLLPQLTLLDLSENSFTGPIPASIGYLTSLTYVDLSSNKLTASLPATLGMLNRTLKYANFSYNQFTGTMDFLDSQGFGGIVSLDLTSNGFTGSIPESIFTASTKAVYLGNNCLSGSLPLDVCRAVNMTALDLDSASSGDQCDEPNTMLYTVVSKFITLDGSLVSNKLRGEIPLCIWSSLRSIEILHLSGNKLGGRIGEVEGLHSLRSLNLANNELIGELPSSVQVNANLRLLDVSNNKFTGVLDKDFTLSNSSLTSLYLFSNRLSGAIPETLVGADMMKMDMLYGNIFYCDTQDPLPMRDVKYKHYDCGAFNLTAAVNIFIIFGSIFITFAALIGYHVHIYGKSIASKNKQQPGEAAAATAPETPDLVSFRDMPPRSVEGRRTLAGMVVACVQGVVWCFECLRDALQEAAQKIHTWLGECPQDFTDSTLRIDGPRKNSMIALRQSNFFLMVLRQMEIAITLVFVFYITVVMFSYVALKSSVDNLVASMPYTTRAQQSQWILTSAYLSGALPASLLTFFNIISGLMICSPFFGIFHSQDNSLFLKKQGNTGHRGSAELESMLQTLNDQYKSSYNKQSGGNSFYVRLLAMCCKYVILPATLQIVSIVVTFSINGAYVSGISKGTNYQSLIAQQIALGCFNIFWSVFFVDSFSISLLRSQDYSKHYLMLYRQIMSIAYKIMGPILMTMSMDNECFYHAIVRQPLQTTLHEKRTYYLEQSLQYSHSPIAYSYASAEASSSYLYANTSKIPWRYTYECSSSLLSNYVPVFIYMFTISGLIFPIVQLVGLTTDVEKLGPRARRVMTALFSPGSIRSATLERDMIEQPRAQRRFTQMTTLDEKIYGIKRQGYSKQQLFKGTDTMAAILDNMFVLLTFGMASPILAIVITMTIIIEITLWRLMIGRYLFFAHNGSKSSVILRVYAVMEYCCSGAAVGLRNNILSIVITSSLFWGFMVFDPVADAYTVKAGSIVSSILFFVSPTIFTIYFYESYVRSLRTRAYVAVMAALGYEVVETGRQRTLSATDDFESHSMYLGGRAYSATTVFNTNPLLITLDSPPQTSQSIVPDNLRATEFSI